MLAGPFHMAFYWGIRNENALSCARRAVSFLSEMKPLSPLFDKWITSVNGSRSRDSNVAVNESSLLKLFCGGVHRRDLDRSVMEDLGYSVSLTNHQSNITLRMHCGEYCGVSPNVVAIEVAEINQATEHLLGIPLLIDICKIAVHCWDPDHGHVAFDTLLDAVEQPNDTPQFGLVTYLSSEFSVPDRVRQRFRVERITDGGYIIVAVSDQYCQNSRSHIEAVRDLVALYSS
jgi:hypothetical protein